MRKEDRVEVAVYLRFKRICDIIFSASVLVSTAPLLALSAAAVALCIQRPVMFVQVRPGRGRKPFKLYKFRTMRDPMDADGRALTDEERTPLIGRLLRLTRLDELPQFWNVLIGDMAVIGPRPLIVSDLEAMSDRGELRLRTKPGITGWAQVNGGHQLAADQKLALDLWYSEHASIALDIRIVWRTLIIALFGEKRDEAAITKAASITLPSRPHESERKKIFVAPGALAKSTLSFLFSKKAFENIFSQAIVDMREEHADALAEGCIWKARWIVVRDHLHLGLTVAAYLSATVIKKVVSIWRIIP